MANNQNMSGRGRGTGRGISRGRGRGRGRGTILPQPSTSQLTHPIGQPIPPTLEHCSTSQIPAAPQLNRSTCSSHFQATHPSISQTPTAPQINLSTSNPLSQPTYPTGQPMNFSTTSTQPPSHAQVDVASADSPHVASSHVDPPPQI